ncbi:hypothetical protein Ahy_B03g065815 [Arachis hypogaea]|uniref:Choline transporter-like protein n=1 Tax=Arachis hypogaea TaxID=3818 RepID=A0A445A2N5_ARAHY|nr:hypothetical protein Ahy_B03g065815 [Arachis hypogaea]
MQSSTKFGFLRALTRNLGSACLGSLFVPAIEATSRFLNLVEGEDEFLFARCCFRVTESIFRYGNGWAYVQIAAYGKGFVAASQDTWSLFKRLEMEQFASSLGLALPQSLSLQCLLGPPNSTKISLPSSPFSHSSLDTFWLTRIAMALPQACVSCYYVCYAENPDNRLFDTTIKDFLDMVKSGRHVAVSLSRHYHGGLQTDS